MYIYYTTDQKYKTKTHNKVQCNIRPFLNYAVFHIDFLKTDFPKLKKIYSPN